MSKAILISMLLVSAPAPDAPEATVQALLDAVKTMASDAAPAAAKRHAIATTHRLVDVSQLSRFALAGRWDTLSGGEREAFVDLLTKLLERRAFAKAGTFFEGLTVEIEREKHDGDTAVVTTSVVSKDEGRVVIEYHVEHGTITDVLLDGVSLRMNLRSQVQKILAEDSFAGLLSRMKSKLEGDSE